MKAMTVEQYGDNSEFKMADIPKPDVTAKHILVRIAATSVNPVDTKIHANGADLPFAPELPAVLGMDFAGTVEAVGEGVTEFSEGDEVYGCAGGLGDLQGTLTEYINADVRLVAKKPANLSMREAAALPLVSITAYEGLTRAGTTSGQKVLVHGGSGGVGHIAVQLAKALGAQVFATAGSEEKLAMIRELGATPINYKTESVADYVEAYTDEKGFDVVFDSVGSENIATSLEAAKLNGQIATTVSTVEVDLSQAHIKGLSLHVVFMLIPMIHNVGREAHAIILKEVAKLAEAGKLKPVVDENHYSLSQVGNAHARLLSGKGKGKVVIDIE